LGEAENRADTLQFLRAGTLPILPGSAELREFLDAELVEVKETELVRVGSISARNSAAA
jgi:hypothetical protein